AEREKTKAWEEMVTDYSEHKLIYSEHEFTRALKEIKELREMTEMRTWGEKIEESHLVSDALDMLMERYMKKREMKKMIHVQQALEYWEAKLSEKKINLGHGICYERIPDTRASLLPERHSEKTLFKVKRGLRGFVNGARVSALADTGCSGNLVSLAFAQEMKLALHGAPTKFVLGNSTSIKSLGTVTLDWAFSDNPRDLSRIICDVLPQCNYPMILGSPFLTATKTLSKYRRRLTECLFSTVNVLRMNFLGDDDSRLLGYIGGGGGESIKVAAVPDTGAEGNVMDRTFAVQHGLYIHGGRRHRNLLQFADGTYQKTVGQVKTHWTFESGERVPITFEVLENCCSDVILGDTILYDHNVFDEHAASISLHQSQHDIHRLAPFDFVKNWQRNSKTSTFRVFQTTETDDADRQ
ncbi:MAG: hypothetical protein LQ349_008318, partial [Xanthoria aureola]